MVANSERKIFSLPGENSLTLFFGRVSSSGKGNRKSLKFFPLKKKWLFVPIHLKDSFRRRNVLGDRSKFFPRTVLFHEECLQCQEKKLKVCLFTLR